MSRRWVVLVACVAAAAGVSGIHGLAKPAVAGPVVKIGTGTLLGERYGASPQAAAFLGIPYQVRTEDQYKEFLRADAGRYANEELGIYPVKSDADVPGQYVRLQSDEFAYNAYSMAQAVTRAGENAFLYNFTYADSGKRAALGAHHGEELFFLGEAFPESWEPQADDRKFGETLRSYWVHFVKDGNPNGNGVAPWPSYKQAPERAFELGARIGDRRVEPRVVQLEAIMAKIVREQG